MDDEKLHQFRVAASRNTLISDSEMDDFNTTGHGYIAHQLTTMTTELVPLLLEYASDYEERSPLNHFLNDMIDKMAEDLTDDRLTSGFYGDE